MKAVLRSALLAWSFLAGGPVLAAASFVAVDEPTFRLADGGVEVRGLSASQEGFLTQLSVEELQRVLTLHVGSAHPESGGQTEQLPAMVGRVTILDSGALRFQPRFPLLPGTDYRATLTIEADLGGPFTATLSLPALEPATPTTSVSAVFPSGNELPENLLRFYLQFDAPMTQGTSYRYVSLLDHEGKPVADAFLELDEELWDSQGKRLTLLFDPGRIKSGLKPKLEVGSALDVGHHFELVVDQRWPDASGNPMTAEFRHRFRTSPPDLDEPEPDRWILNRPAIGTSEPLVVEFDEPLDHALAARWISVHRNETLVTGMSPLEGSVQVEGNESRWRFTPEQPWGEGHYQLVIDVRLEDRAGNRIDRPFEREADRGAMVTPDGPPTVVLEIELER